MNLPTLSHVTNTTMFLLSSVNQIEKK